MLHYPQTESFPLFPSNPKHPPSLCSSPPTPRFLTPCPQSSTLFLTLPTSSSLSYLSLGALAPLLEPSCSSGKPLTHWERGLRESRRKERSFLVTLFYSNFHCGRRGQRRCNGRWVDWTGVRETRKGIFKVMYLKNVREREG